MRRVVVWALVVFLFGGSLLVGPTAHAQTAVDDAPELTQEEFQNLLFTGQLDPGVYIVDGVYTVVEGGAGPGGSAPNPFEMIPEDYLAGVPAEYRFLVDPREPLPPEFAFLEDPTLPVPPEWAFLVDPRVPVPPEFQWLFGPVPTEASEPAPTIEEPVVVPEVEPQEETPVAEVEAEVVAAADEPEEITTESTLVDSVDDAVEPEAAPAVAAEVPAESPEQSDASADAQTDARTNEVAATSNLTAAQLQDRQPAPSSDTSRDGFIIPLLIFVAVASTAMLAAIPIFLRGRSSNDSALRELALTDDLTKLANRRRLDRDLSSHERANRPIAVAMIDIDHFKRLNDDFSHAIGDVVLQQVAAAIAENIRASDIAYRYGGEEFCVLLPDATEHEAAAVVERVRNVIERIVFAQIDRRVTISAGVAVTGPTGLGEHGTATVQRADAALYAAKDAGRNRVMLGSLVGN